MKTDNPSARPPPYPRDKEGKFKKRRSRVICTHFFHEGKLSRELWLLDTWHSTTYLSPSIIRGYHFWGIRYVKLMRTYPWMGTIMLPIATCRAKEIAFQMGRAKYPNYAGKLVRLIGEPICWILGLFISEQNWESLYQQTTNEGLIK